jgi:hypothetical protein
MTMPGSAPPDTAASASGAPVPSSPRPQPLGLLWALDAILCGLVLVFAFLASSFVIRNSEFWFHLASGRLLANGRYAFGVDPFCCTTANAYWTNHSWLFDWLLYLLHDRIGAAGLVVLKALLIALLAAVLIRIRLPDGCRAVSAGCAALALLACSAQLTLQPVCLSYFLLGVLLWLLWRYQNSPRPEEPTTFRQELRRLGWVLVLLVLWVNVDSWFLMGLFVIALFWAGSWFDPRLSCPAWLLPLGVAVCVLNPHHFHAFTWPAELSSVPWTSGLRIDPRFQAEFRSPWMLGVHFQPAAAVNLAQWGFFLLVFLGLLSFVAVSHDLSGWRCAVWLGLAVVGSWQLGMMPFFAVAAAPITALNFQQWLHERGRLPRGPALVGRLALLAGCLGLIALTWRGWLHGFHDQGRRIGWGVEPNPSLERAALQLARWSKQGQIPEDAHVFNTNPEAAHYLAWLAPGQKSFLDHRWPLFRQTARDFESVCRALDLGTDAATGPSADRQANERVFHAFDIAYVLVYDPQLDRVLSVQRRLVSNPHDWTLLDIDGQAVLHGYNGGDPERHAALAFRPEHWAFAENQQEPWTAPARGPTDELPPETRSPWPSWESAAALVCLATQEGLTQHSTEQARRLDIAAHVAALAGLPTTWAGPLGTWSVRYFPDSPGPSPALVLLAIRVARRALAADPRDAKAWASLAEAYLMLHTSSTRPFAEPAGTHLADLRSIQIFTALHNALRLEPDKVSWHLALAEHYDHHQHLDLALDHQREAVRLLHARGLSEVLAGAEREQQRLEQAVQKQQQKLLRQAPGLGEDPVQRALLARQLGLPRQALEDILLPSGPGAAGTPGFKLELQLLLILGRADEARQRIDEARRALQGTATDTGQGEGPRLPPDYDWILVCVSAANGDYEEAEALLRAEQGRLAQLVPRTRETLRRRVLAAVASEVALMAQWRPFLPEMADLIVGERLREWRIAPLLLQSERVDLAEVAALLALERGEPAVARASLQEALELLGSLLPQAEQDARRRLALGYLHLLDQAKSTHPAR